MKRVVMSAMIEPFPVEDLTAADEVWCVSGAFRHQQGLRRVFVMDELMYYPAAFADELNLLPADVAITTTRPVPELPRSRPYPLTEVLAGFGGLRYFTCTVAYMIALAIHERFDQIVLAGMYHQADSEEYLIAKSCVEFWMGIAIGRGIHVGLHGNTALCRPLPWEPPLYGYCTNESREVIHAAMAAAYRFAVQFPSKHIVHTPVEALGFEPPAPPPAQTPAAPMHQKEAA